jgi:hypothetical protein
MNNLFVERGRAYPLNNSRIANEKGIYLYRPLKFMCKCIIIYPEAIETLEMLMINPRLGPNN